MKRRLALSLLSASASVVALACGSGVDTPPDQPPVNDTGTIGADGGGDLGTDAPIDAPPTTVCRATATVTVGVPVAEVRSKTPIGIDVTIGDDGGAKDPHPLKVVLERAGEIEKTLVDAPKPLGKVSLTFVPGDDVNTWTGAYVIKATVGCPASATDAKPGEGTGKLNLVRLAAARITVKDGEGGGRVPLMYHALDHSSLNYFPIPATMAAAAIDSVPGEPELDKKDGTPRPFPAPWDDLDSPPVDGSGAVMEYGFSLPTSVLLGTKPDLVFTIGKTAKSLVGSQPTGLKADGVPPIRLVVDGSPGTDTALVTEGGDVTVRLATAPVTAVDRVDAPLKWHFEYKDAAGAWQPLAGATQEATLRFYGVLGNEQGTTSPNLPWVAVVDAVTKRVAGKAADADKVRAILVQYINEESGLKYDRKSGASVYTKYPSSWPSASYGLGAYLKRSYGSIVNCSDCASILSTHANMVGAKLHYAIIGWSFALNPIEGIGSTTFGSPFDSGGMGFSYHAVTTRDATAHIHDATLALDGDSDPKTAPYTRLLVQDIPGAEYLTRLSPGTPLYQYKDQKTSVY